MINDQISDLLTRIRNAQRAGHRTASVVGSAMNARFLEVLKKEGLIESYDEEKQDDAKNKTPGKKFSVSLKYYSSGKPVISLARRVSKPGCRKYSPSEKLPKVLSGLGIAVVSTSKGVMSDRDARKLRIGGEVLALVG